MKLHVVFLVAIFSLAYTQLVKGQHHQPGKDCTTRCGNVTVEYPFSISSDCYSPEKRSFNLNCSEKGELFYGSFQVINISHSGELRVNFNVSSTCFDDQGNISGGRHISYRLSRASISNKNKFTLVGCNAFASLRTFSQNRNYSTGCLSFCDSLPAPTRQCNGEGCCMSDVSIPLDVSSFFVSPSRYPNLTSVHSFNRCIYAFLVEDGKFNFSSSEDLMNLRNVNEFPVVLDWSIGNQTCKEVGKTSICGGNSECFDSSSRGKGYNCRCLLGFDGNPYLSDGCQDINECSSIIHKHNCSAPSTCVNTMGRFLCTCPSGYDFNATFNGCTRKERPKFFGLIQIVLGTTIGFLVILLVVTCIQHRMKHRKIKMLRQQFFEKNGGGMLKQGLARAGSFNFDVQIFTEEDMKIATNGYEESRILGRGGQGTVYKGILQNKSIVAIKKARLGDDSQVEQFINEMLVLSKINHRNVVKLLGCCLETEVPLLVYEYIANGTLFDHLHGSLFDSSLTWEHRLRIAIQVAGTLAYLHSSAEIPIIHRDIKTANILLDDNLNAKVADFGASRLIPMDKEQLTTMVQGTLGYLDPEYFKTGLLNEKSDVYSFGVVLMELLSGQKAMCFERPQYSKYLASYFTFATNENRLHEVIDGKVMYQDNHQEIHEVAGVAVLCTRAMGEERPRMKEVAAELEGLRDPPTKRQKSDKYHKAEETPEHLHGSHILHAQGNTSSSGYDNQNIEIMDTEAGR